MSELERTILTTLVDLLKTGGQYAIIGIIVWFTFQLLKIGIIGGLIWVTTRGLCQTLANIIVIKTYSKQQQITLLSNKVSKHLQDTISDFQSKSTSLIENLVKSVKDLKENSEKTTKKTA